METLCSWDWKKKNRICEIWPLTCVGGEERNFKKLKWLSFDLACYLLHSVKITNNFRDYWFYIQDWTSVPVCTGLASTWVQLDPRTDFSFLSGSHLIHTCNISCYQHVVAEMIVNRNFKHVCFFFPLVQSIMKYKKCPSVQSLLCLIPADIWWGLGSPGQVSSPPQTSHTYIHTYG